MGYYSIDNLYKNQDIFLFKECYAMEKIHGTSAHIGVRDEKIRFFSGGVPPEEFVKLFDVNRLLVELLAIATDITVYGEAYGGKCQGMSKTYGKELKFVAFEVKIGYCWLNVPMAEEIVKRIGLEFVDYAKIPTDVEYLDKERARCSSQAVRNGMGGDHLREGIVCRPLIEVVKNNGERVIVKYKNEEFQETKKKREIGKDKLEILTRAEDIAIEWATEMRLDHILSDYREVLSIEHTGEVIKLMLADIAKESVGEIEWGHEARKAIGKAVAKMFRKRLGG